ncbi:TetR/AcrR family transcriptional regulator [Demequina sp. TTPB684]|uniref:TetR/AcrR family transcriptional regulator n=1 Tax=unclassified Demequina TaxID=2620311 RepID=UPI001CF204CC|nr:MULTISPECIES: TetR/AcrR family transcriptional regulator [unclassified Demequina]MCB2412752.1 TetR/AcrR family transcriptional regulator [Demequina sp. TTPB684]UPU88871.1 TetR/AcrR family transcriptional regulator [Demequina sp. TMPB413]
MEPIPSPAPTRRRRLSPEQRLAEVIAAATRLVAERGYNGLTLQAVATACGMSVPGLLHYAGSKDGLLVAVLAHRDQVDLAVTGLDSPPRGDVSPRAMLDALVAHNAGQREIVRLYTVLNAESLNPDHPAHAYFTRRYQDAFERLSALLSAHYANAEALAHDVIAAMDGAQLQWLRFPESVDLVEAWNRQADAIFASATPARRSKM